MDKLLFTILIFSTFVLSCFGQVNTTQEKVFEQNTFAEDYEFISKFFIAPSKHVKIIGSKSISPQIIPQTVTMEDKKDWKNDRDFLNALLSMSIPRLKQSVPEITDDLISNFNRKNEQPHFWEKKFGDSGKYKLLGKHDISSKFIEDQNGNFNWKLFRETYPKANGSLYHFSRVGFSDNNETALILVSFACGFLCASQDYYYFVKENGNWIQKKKINIWVS